MAAAPRPEAQARAAAETPVPVWSGTPVQNGASHQYAPDAALSRVAAGAAREPDAARMADPRHNRG